MKSALVPSRGDLFGGISAGVTALPLCLGLGVLSGLGPEAGLYGAIALGICASLFGGAPVLVSGPTTPMTLVTAGVVAATLRPNGEANLSLVVAVFLLTGAFQVALGLLRLGRFIRYVPYPVISGFMSGIGIIIIVQQIFPLAGMAQPASDPAAIIARLHTLPAGFAWPVALLSAATLAIIYLLPRVIRVVPSSLLALRGSDRGFAPVRHGRAAHRRHSVWDAGHRHARAWHRECEVRLDSCGGARGARCRRLALGRAAGR